MEEGVALLALLFTNINNIFTGDELFILNPITWSKLEINPEPGFSITKTWYDAGSDKTINLAGDTMITDGTHNNRITDWRTTAQSYKDHGMEWLCTTANPTAKTIWTTLDFNLIQLWVKNSSPNPFS